MLLTQIIDEPNRKKAARPKHQADRYWHIAKMCGAAEVPPLDVQPRPASKDVIVGIFARVRSMARQSAGPPTGFRKTMELLCFAEDLLLVGDRRNPE